MKQLPMVRVEAFGKSFTALLDSGCSKTIVSKKVAGNGRVVPYGCGVKMLNGSKAECRATYRVKFTCIEGSRDFVLECLVGMDAITAAGGATIYERGEVKFGRGSRGDNCCAVGQEEKVRTSRWNGVKEGGQLSGSGSRRSQSYRMK